MIPDKLLKTYDLELSSGEPINEDSEHVYELKGGKVIKLVNDLAEIKAIDALLGKECEYIAKILAKYEYEDETFIVVEKVDELTEEEEDSYGKFKKFNLLIALMVGLVQLLTLTFVKLRFTNFYSWYKGTNKDWFDLYLNMMAEANKHGVEYPDDFFISKNMGTRNGKVVCFDIRDEYSNFVHNRVI
jgi:hypothetical protein